MLVVKSFESVNVYNVAIVIIIYVILRVIITGGICIIITILICILLMEDDLVINTLEGQTYGFAGGDSVHPVDDMGCYW